MRTTVAQRLFLASGIYGLAVIAPMFFMEHPIGEHDPPSITHAEFYYGFVCTEFAWQIVYLLMSRDPIRFRPMLIPAVVGKAGFAISVFVLFAQRRLAAWNVVLPAIDFLLAALFVWAFVALGRHAPSEERGV